MKAQKISLTMLAIAMLLFIGSDIFAQRGMGNNREQRQKFDSQGYCSNIPDLTPEQEAKIKALQVNHLKQRTDFRNQMNELRAKKQTLMTSEKSDLNAINGTIDQMTALQNKMQKERAKHYQDIRSTLTDAQKVYFDSRHGMGRGNKSGRGMRAENGNGYGNGNGRGRN